MMDLRYMQVFCFNSSMVRLGGILYEQSLKVITFQFQYGAIGSLSAKQAAFVPSSCFNSSMVRLGVEEGEDGKKYQVFQFQYGAIGRRPRRIHKKTSNEVSIPVWCDWELIFVRPLV